MLVCKVYRRYEGNRIKYPVEVGDYIVPAQLAKDEAVFLRDNGNAVLEEIADTPAPKTTQRKRK